MTIPPSISRSSARRTEGSSIPTPADEDLIRGIARKDPSAFQEFVERHQGLVYSTCLNLLHDHPQAQDAAQDVFLQVYRSAAEFRFESKATTWLYRIAVNLSLNLIRRNRRVRWIESLSFSASEELPSETLPPGAQSGPPDRVYEETERGAMLQRAVAALPDKQRVALVLNKYEGFTAGEIAEILGVSQTAVEARLRRAKAELKRKVLERLRAG